MNEQYLCRGKRLDNGEWVVGYYMPHYYSSRHGCIAAIFHNDDAAHKTYRIPVDPSTVGRCTEVRDINGKLVFEWDILKAREKDCDFWLVFYEERGFSIIRPRLPLRTRWPLPFAQSSVKYNALEIVGCLPDDHELLDGGQDG